MITILMPIYNGIEFIQQSVKSVLYQNYKDWELIIGVNGHSKNSDVFLTAKNYETKDSRIQVFDLFECKGKSNTLNKMLTLAKYNWIALLDVDDIWLPKKLESQVPHMSQYDIIGTQCKYFGDLNISPAIPLGDISKYDFLVTNPIINSSCLIKKELCYWDANEMCEDYDLWIRLWRKHKKFFNVQSIQVLHRIHQQSAFNSKGNNNTVKNLKQKYVS